MKLRRFAAVSAATALVVTGIAPVADAATYPEPLNQVLDQMRAIGGPQAPNLLLVPAGLSAASWSLFALGVVLALIGLL